MQEDEEEVVERGSGRGEMEAGLQMDAGAPVLLGMGAKEALETGVNGPCTSELVSRAGEDFFLTGRFLLGVPGWVCCCC